MPVMEDEDILSSAATVATVSLLAAASASAMAVKRVCVFHDGVLIT